MKYNRLCDLSARHLLAVIRCVSKNSGYLEIVGFTKQPTGVLQKHEDGLDRYGVSCEYIDQKQSGEDHYYGFIFYPYSEKLWIKLSFNIF